MTRKKKTTKKAVPEVRLNNPDALEAVQGIAGPTDEASEAFEPAIAAKAEEPELVVETTETLQGAVETVSVDVEVKGETTAEDTDAALAKLEAKLRSSLVVTIDESPTVSLGTDQHGGIRSDRMLTRSKDGLSFGVDPAGPTARVSQRGDVWLGQAMYGQAVITRVRADSEVAAIAELARGIHEASKPEAEAFRRAVKWGEL